MCSVLDCESFRRGVLRFKLPDDPEKRLEWVQFIFEVNGQRLKETSWTDITVCREHFTDDCFENPNTGSGSVQLKPSVVPSLCIKSEPDDPAAIPQHVVHMETTDTAIQCDDPNTTCHPTVRSKKSDHSYTDLNKNIAAPQEEKEKYVVNENCLLELFGRKCPLCKSKLQLEKITYEELIILNQRCLKCCYTNQWKSQVNADVPSDAGRRLPGGSQADDDKPSVVVLSEMITFSDEDSDSSDEEEGDEDNASSDREWNPAEVCLLAEDLTKHSEDESAEEDDEEELDSHGGLKINELCTECGSFFNILRPHKCEHKVKPYSCNICGKRCVTELSLKYHSRIHDATYEQPCKYCYVTFKTKADKLKHEQTHQERKDRYKCPDCPETFATNKQRTTHLAKHRAPKEFRCGVCGIDFRDVHHLRRHSVVHTGLKPYKCSVCQRGFNQTSHLKSHMRLHTGEKPYKCQHCDKSFNHNVSLKSHIQRCHSSTSGREWETGEVDERINKAEVNGNKKDTDSDNAEQDTEEVLQKKEAESPKGKRRSTGRPRGRPKSHTTGSKVVKDDIEGKTAKTKVWKVKRMGSSEEESEGEQSGSDLSSDSAGEEEERVRTSLKRGLEDISDSVFIPKEEGRSKKRYSCQNTSKRLGKHGSRPRKSLA